MKRNLIVFVVFLFVSVGLSAQVVKPLDAVIEEAAKTIENALPKGTKLAVLNFTSSSETFSNYVIDEFTGALVRGRKVTMVDRQNLALIRQEMNLQLSGDVSDESVLSIGRQVGAQSIVSGALTNLGNYYRFRVRVINVETAAIQEQYSYNMQNDAQVAFLLYGNQGNVTTSSSATTMNPTQTTTTQNNSSTPNVNIVNGVNVQEKLKWLETNAVNNTEYRIVVNSNENLSAPILSYPRRRNVTIRLISSGGEKVLSLTGSGSIFTIDSDVTLILDKGITLKGLKKNNTSLIMVNSRGTLIMNEGVKISGNENTTSYGGGVFVNENGIFIMNGGEIYNNTAASWGGGIYVKENGIFNMSGGEIYSNSVSSYSSGGGGVCVYGTFTMTNGEISKNESRGSSDSNNYSGGGGVFIYGSKATFIMKGGVIFGNISATIGGGVSVDYGIFTMTGGEISGNTSKNLGGGVYIGTNRNDKNDKIESFSKTGGIIYGSSGISNDSNENKSINGGNAVYVYNRINGNKLIRNSTVGVGISLYSSRTGAAGGWEN